MEKQTEEQKTEWFNKLRLNSWEVEILIVGFVLVMLFQITGSLDLETYKIFDSADTKPGENHMSWALMFGQMFSIWAIIWAVNILIYSFAIYLGFRGFWVGILGLSSVFPKGINYKKLNFNNRLTLDPEKYNLGQLINSIDKICSSIFSFSFLISFSLASIMIFLTQIFIIGFALDQIASASSFLDSIFEIIIIIYSLLGLIFFIDFFLFSVLKRIPWRPFSSVYYYINKFYRYVTLVFIYEHIYYIFISNIKRRYLLLLLLVFILLSKFFEPLDDRLYFPSLNSKSKNIMQFSYYENQFKFIEIGDEGSYPELPFINSDIISSNYLKLYIPYSPSINNSLRDVCPEIQKINANNIEEQLENDALQCINDRYILWIDDEEIQNDFIFYYYSLEYVNMSTFFMIVPLENIANGKHVLSIGKKIIKKDDKEKDNLEIDKNIETNDIKKEWENRIIRSIPFYIFKD